MVNVADIQAQRAKAAAIKNFTYFAVVVSFFAGLPFCTIGDSGANDSANAGLLQERVITTDLDALAIENLLAITVTANGGSKLKALVHRGEHREDGDGVGIRLSTSAGVVMAFTAQGMAETRFSHDNIFSASLKEVGFKMVKRENSGSHLPLEWELESDTDHVVGTFGAGTFACTDPALLGANTCAAQDEKEVG